MPAIYSFSLDVVKHREFITMLESSKNKSDLIRHALHQVTIMVPEREYVTKLEKLVRSYATLAEAPEPNLKAIWERCYYNHSTKQEQQDSEHVPLKSRNSSQEQE